MVYWIRFWLALSQMDNSSKMRARGRQAGRQAYQCLLAGNKVAGCHSAGCIGCGCGCPFMWPQAVHTHTHMSIPPAHTHTHTPFAVCATKLLPHTLLCCFSCCRIGFKAAFPASCSCCIHADDCDNSLQHVKHSTC